VSENDDDGEDGSGDDENDVPLDEGTMCVPPLQEEPSEDEQPDEDDQLTDVRDDAVNPSIPLNGT